MSKNARYASFILGCSNLAILISCKEILVKSNPIDRKRAIEKKELGSVTKINPREI